MNTSPKKLQLVVALVASAVLIAGGVRVAARDDAGTGISKKNPGAASKSGSIKNGSSKNGSKQGSRSGEVLKPPVGAKAAGAGVYRYTVQRSGQKDVGITEMRIEPAVRSDTGLRQRFVSGGTDSYVALIEEWRPDGLYLLKRENKTAGGSTSGCSFSAPANAVYSFPLKVGKSWATTWPNCGYPPTTSHVIGRERLSIGGVAVDTYVVRGVIRGAFTETRTLWYSPGWHLLVKRVVSLEGKHPKTGKRSTSTTTETLTSLKPA